MNAIDIITGFEKDFGTECTQDFDDVLCNNDTCRHAECECWDDLRRQVRWHLEEQVEKLKLRGSMTLWDLKELLTNSAGSLDQPVFINGEPINEAHSDGECFHITTKDSYTAAHPVFEVAK